MSLTTSEKSTLTTRARHIWRDRHIRLSQVVHHEEKMQVARGRFGCRTSLFLNPVLLGQKESIKMQRLDRSVIFWLQLTPHFAQNLWCHGQRLADRFTVNDNPAVRPERCRQRHFNVHDSKLLAVERFMRLSPRSFTYFRGRTSKPQIFVYPTLLFSSYGADLRVLVTYTTIHVIL